ncbi:MAG: hypothetical protein AAF581_14705 [Planctomycetota bacterium]
MNAKAAGASNLLVRLDLLAKEVDCPLSHAASAVIKERQRRHHATHPTQVADSIALSVTTQVRQSWVVATCGD